MPVSFTVAEFIIALSADRKSAAVANGIGLPAVSATRPDTCPKALAAIRRYNKQMMKDLICVCLVKRTTLNPDRNTRLTSAGTRLMKCRNGKILMRKSNRSKQATGYTLPNAFGQLFGAVHLKCE
jgi:hypothetical protein